MSWPVLRQNGLLLDATAWNEVVAGLSAWAGDVNARAHNLSNLGVLTFGAGGYVNNGFRIHVAADQNLTLQTGGGEGFRLNSHNDAGNANTPLAMVASSYYFGGGNVGIGRADPLAYMDVALAPVENVTQILGRWGVATADGYSLKLWQRWDNNGIWHGFRQRAGDVDYEVLSFFGGNAGFGTTTPTARVHAWRNGRQYHWRIRSAKPSRGHRAALFIGRTYGAANGAGYIGYTPHATSNLSTFGFWGTDNLLNITANGNVGIAISNPVAPLHIATAAAVGDSPIMRFGYAGSDSVYNLAPRRNVSAGVVKYAFDVTNESVAFANNLVLDRGMVGIGALPDYQLVIANNYAAGVIRIGAESDYLTRVKSDTHLALQTGMGADVLHVNSGIETLRTSYLGWVIQSVPNTATADASINNGHLSIWFEECGNRLVFRCRTSGGVLKTGYVAVS